MSTSLRKLAIRLACAHPEDRQWLLGQLTAAERQQMDELLQEISLLGLAADPAIVEAVMHEAEQAGLPADEQTGPLNEAADPFWLGLGLQTLTAEARRQYLDVRHGGKPSLLKWHKTFADEVLPPALLLSLKAQLETREDDHERV
ncbi:MAG TPA: hypothetical protein VJA19_22195 [Pseudomonas sp.]|nr:hypothetical protein [Pseudomonas sp.]